jgi:hypothetical protein
LQNFDNRNVMRNYVKVRPHCSKTDPRVCSVTHAKKTFCMMARTQNSSNWHALIGQTGWDLLRLLSEQLVQARAIALAGDWGGHCVILKSSKAPNFLLGDMRWTKAPSMEIFINVGCQPWSVYVTWILNLLTFQESKFYLRITGRSLIHELFQLQLKATCWRRICKEVSSVRCWYHLSSSKASSLKHQFIGRHDSKGTDDLSKNVSSTLKFKCSNFVLHSVAMDESTYSTDTAQLATFVRRVYETFNNMEELASLAPVRTLQRLFIPTQRTQPTTDGVPTLGNNGWVATMTEKGRTGIREHWYHDVSLYWAPRKFECKLLPWISTCDECRCQDCKFYLVQRPQPQALPKHALWMLPVFGSTVVSNCSAQWRTWSQEVGHVLMMNTWRDACKSQQEKLNMILTD